MNHKITKLFALFFAVVMTNEVEAQTFTKDVASIIYNKCTTCHRSGEIGPQSFTNYEEVKNWAPTIKYVTGIGYMPPWQADPDYNHFLDENYLTDEEIQIIADWVDAGTPYGVASEEPQVPDYPQGSLLGEPDLVLSFAEAHIHPGNNKDEYRYFVLPNTLTEDKVIKAIELRPGNTKIVHHCLFFEDRLGVAAAEDAKTPEYGFDGFGSFGTGEVLNHVQYPGYTPGTKPMYFPESIGQKMHAGADLVIQMHYAPWPVDAADSSTVNIFFADESEEQIERLVTDHVMLPFDNTLTNGPFYLFPQQTKTFHGVWTVNTDLSLIGLFPHMHLLGKDWEVYMIDPNGNRTDFISIPEWDFNWQGFYYFTQFMVAKAGTKIHAYATYDNSSDNPNNPNNPPKFVTWGERTEDEMYYLSFLTIPYEEGDEDVVFGGTTSTNDPELDETGNILYTISPNPVSEGLTNVSFQLKNGAPVNIEILDIRGNKIKTLRKNEFFGSGTHTVHFNASHLSTGVYIVNLNGKRFSLNQKFVKM